MKEWFLQPEDGEEFKVFYLGDGSNVPNKPNKDICEHGVSGCCPIGPKGEQGEKGVSLDPTKGEQAHHCPPSIFSKAMDDAPPPPPLPPLPPDLPHIDEDIDLPAFTYPLQELPPATEPVKSLTGTTVPPSLSQDPTLGGVYEEPSDLPFIPDIPSADPADGEPLYGEHHPLCSASADSIKDKWMKKLFQEVKGKFEKKKLEKLSVEIDDTIESDIIKDPVVGRIYKVAGLNMIVRFAGLQDTKPNLWEVDYHGNNFYISVNSNMLVKATEYEVELYLDNE